MEAMRITLLSLTSVLLLSGCATVMDGSDQSINVNTTGCEDYNPIVCTVSNSDGSSVITAPASVSVEKARGDLSITCESRNNEATGSLMVESGYDAMNMGNLLLGGIIGLGVDAATGAMWHYPSAVIIPLSCPGPS